MDYKNAKGGEEFKQFVRQNVLEFRRKFPEFNKKKLVVCTESNGRYDGDLVKDVLFDEGPVFKSDRFTNELIGEIEFLSDNGLKSGINKTRQRTMHYILHTSDHVRTDRLLIHHKVGTGNTNPANTIEKILAELLSQLCRFKYPDADPDNSRYSTGSGKITAKCHGQNDDVAVTLMMLIYFSFFATRNQDQYEKFLETVTTSPEKIVGERGFLVSERIRMRRARSEMGPI